MKTFIAMALAAATFAACNENEPANINSDTRDTATIAPEAPATVTTVYTPAEGDVTYVDKKVMVMKNGQWVEADKTVTLDNGVVVKRTGKVEKEGKIVTLEDGEVVNREGNFFDKTGHAIENAWDDTKEGAKKAGKAIEKGAQKVGDEAHDAVHDDEHDRDKK